MPTPRVVDPIYIPLTVVTPAGTVRTAPQLQFVVTPPGQLLTITLQIPPGHCGTTGLRVELAQTPILPYTNPGDWIVGDNFVETYDLDIEIGRRLRIATFNEGNYAHTHYMRAKIRTTFDRAPAGVVQLVDLNGRLS